MKRLSSSTLVSIRNQETLNGQKRYSILENHPPAGYYMFLFSLYINALSTEHTEHDMLFESI